MTGPSIADLPRLVSGLADEDRLRFDRLFHLAAAGGQTVPPASMHDWLVKQFGSLDAVRRQQIVRVTNRWTLEGALYNTLRASRPIEGAAAGRDPAVSDEDDLEKTIRDSAGNAFCHPLERTPADVFGRIRGRHSVTASNVAKCDAWHGVVVFDEHHPLRFGAEEVADYVDTAQAWARAAYQADPEARFPLFIWNCLWRSGASILHGHAQMVVTRGLHFARVEAWRQAAERYRAAHGADYFADVVAVMRALGLATGHGAAVLFPTLTPFKEKETHIVAPRLDDDLKDAVYVALRTLVDRLAVRSFNLALYQPPLGPADAGWDAFPFVVRLIDRGALDQKTSDLGAMELFGQSVVASDPFALAASLREAGVDWLPAQKG